MSSPLVWIITGTSSGIGRGLAIAALKRGEKVIATARARSIHTLQALKDQGADILELDVTASPDEIKEVAKRAHAMYGRIDVVVNNAGYAEAGTVEEGTPEEIYNQFNTNVFGGLHIAHAFLPYMRERKSGTIVWIGSAGGWFGSWGAGLYAATKHAVRAIGESMHQELESFGIRIFVFEPGYFRTDFLKSSNLSLRSKPIDVYEDAMSKAMEAANAMHGKQAGDPFRGGNVIVDVVRGEGCAKDRKPPVVLQLGSDCYDMVRNKLEFTMKNMEEWKDVICSTDFPKDER